MRKYSLDDYDSDEIAELINQKIHKERYRRVMKLRFIDGMTYEEIAADKQVDRTPRQVGNIIRDCSLRLIK